MCQLVISPFRCSRGTYHQEQNPSCICNQHSVPEKNYFITVCLLISIKELVLQAHIMLMSMIGKLNRDQKADWPKHLPELVHSYNSMRLAITRYSPHYFMIGCQPCLPIAFHFPMMRGIEKHQLVNYYIAKLCA